MRDLKIFILILTGVSLAAVTHAPTAASDSAPEPQKAISSTANESPNAPTEALNIFDDRLLLDGYAQRYANESKDILLERIKDDTLDPFKAAAAVRVFKKQFTEEMVAREKKAAERILLRRLVRADSPFLQVEIMHALCQLDRFRYFETMVPALIVKLDHYNSAVDDLAYEDLNEIIKNGNNRAREARIVFNTLRKILFLTRKRLANVTDPSPRLKQKLEILRWAIKVLGNQEIKRLPKEAINLL